jgi:hypothetical protein
MSKTIQISTTQILINTILTFPCFEKSFLKTIIESKENIMDEKITKLIAYSVIIKKIAPPIG